MAGADRAAAAVGADADDVARVEAGRQRQIHRGAAVDEQRGAAELVAPMSIAPTEVRSPLRPEPTAGVT